MGVAFKVMTGGLGLLLAAGCDTGTLPDAAADAAPSAAVCGDRTITFKLLVDPSDIRPYNIIAGTATCGAWWHYWLSIRPAGAPITAPGDHSHDTPPFDTLYGSHLQSCESCDPQRGYPGACLPGPPIHIDEAQYELDGRFLVIDACGITGCYRTECLPAGEYIATMCGYSDTTGTASTGSRYTGPFECVEVPFTWPPSVDERVIEGTIGGASPDAGG